MSSPVRRSMTPAAHAAAYSPAPWPRTRSGEMPSDIHALVRAYCTAKWIGMEQRGVERRPPSRTSHSEMAAR
eukprot:1180707-Prorocentrum_minimum.AAC.2